MAEMLFSIASKLVGPCWLLLVFVPGWRWSQWLATFAVPLVLAAAYVFLLVTTPHVAGAGFGSVGQVRLLFGQDRALAAGWIHYLAFDLFIGSWETRDARRLGISQWLVAPCLVMTFLLGPLGLGCYLLLRLGMRRRMGVEAEGL